MTAAPPHVQAIACTGEARASGVSANQAFHGWRRHDPPPLMPPPFPRPPFSGLILTPPPAVAAGLDRRCTLAGWLRP